MVTRKKKKETPSPSHEIFPKVVKGSHLTVYTFEDGSTKLEWDDEALVHDVRQAIALYSEK